MCAAFNKWKTVEHDYQGSMKKGNGSVNGASGNCDRKRSQKKWKDLPVTNLGLAINSNVTGRSVAAPLPQVNAWHTKKGSDLFNKKNEHSRDFSAHNEDEEMDEDLRRALAESLRTAEEDKKRQLDRWKIDAKADADFGRKTFANKNDIFVSVSEEGTTSDEPAPVSDEAFKRSSRSSVPPQQEMGYKGFRKDNVDSANVSKGKAFYSSRNTKLLSSTCSSMDFDAVKPSRIKNDSISSYKESEESWDSESVCKEETVVKKTEPIERKVRKGKRRNSCYSLVTREEDCANDVEKNVKMAVHSKTPVGSTSGPIISTSNPIKIAVPTTIYRNRSPELEEDKECVFSQSPNLSEGPEISISSSSQQCTSSPIPSITKDSNQFEKDSKIEYNTEIESNTDRIENAIIKGNTVNCRDNSHHDENSDHDDMEKIDTSLIDSMIKLQTPGEKSSTYIDVTEVDSIPVNSGQKNNYVNIVDEINSKRKEITELLNQLPNGIPVGEGVNPYLMPTFPFPGLGVPPVLPPNFMPIQSMIPPGQPCPEMLNPQLLCNLLMQQLHQQHPMEQNPQSPSPPNPEFNQQHSTGINSPSPGSQGYQQQTAAATAEIHPPPLSVRLPSSSFQQQSQGTQHPGFQQLSSGVRLPSSAFKQQTGIYEQVPGFQQQPMCVRPASPAFNNQVPGTQQAPGFQQHPTCVRPASPAFNNHVPGTQQVPGFQQQPMCVRPASPAFNNQVPGMQQVPGFQHPPGIQPQGQGFQQQSPGSQTHSLERQSVSPEIRPHSPAFQQQQAGTNIQAPGFQPQNGIQNLPGFSFPVFTDPNHNTFQNELAQNREDLKMLVELLAKQNLGGLNGLPATPAFNPQSVMPQQFPFPNPTSQLSFQNPESQLTEEQIRLIMLQNQQNLQLAQNRLFGAPSPEDLMREQQFMQQMTQNRLFNVPPPSAPNQSYSHLNPMGQNVLTTPVNQNPPISPANIPFLNNSSFPPNVSRGRGRLIN